MPSGICCYPHMSFRHVITLTCSHIHVATLTCAFRHVATLTRIPRYVATITFALIYVATLTRALRYDAALTYVANLTYTFRRAVLHTLYPQIRYCPRMYPQMCNCLHIYTIRLPLSHVPSCKHAATLSCTHRHVRVHVYPHFRKYQSCV